MTTFQVHTSESNPDSKSVLDNAQSAFGFVPNLIGVMAESPQVAEAYLTLMNLYSQTDLTDTEREVISMTNNRLNGCEYCMAAHSTVAHMKKLPGDVIASLRDGKPISDMKLEALRVFALQVNVSRGNPTAPEVEALLDAGYSNRTVLEVILGTCMKVLSNYTNHIAETPLDDAFAGNAWKFDECCSSEKDSCSTSESCSFEELKTQTACSV